MSDAASGPLARLRRLLAHPLTAGLDLDDPRTTALRRQVIAGKPVLKALYDEWYRALAAAVPEGPGAVVELGSGAGHGQEHLPALVTSEAFACPGVDLVADAQRLPFRGGALKALVFTNVLHHLSDVRRFFAEAVRCLRPGGRVLMVEPWPTAWSRFVWRNLHHEPFDLHAPDWAFPPAGPLSGANGALPWLVFARDRPRFEAEFPALAVERVEPTMPFRYLLSGGVGLRALAPAPAFPVVAALEQALAGQADRLGMFAFIALRRR